MVNNREAGAGGEDLAASYLKRHGDRIIKRNHRDRGGEIDIIAEKRGELVFCEVKTRNSLAYGSGLDAVVKAKQRRIIRCAKRFLASGGFGDHSIRFDVISVDSRDIKHIEGAFLDE